MSTKKIWTILSLIIFALQLAVETATAAIIIRLNILPNVFLTILLAVLALLLLLTGALMFLHGKKPVSILRRVIAWILAILIILGCGLVAKLAADAYSTIHAVTTSPAEEADIGGMYVLVRMDDPAQTYADTANYNFGIIEDYDVGNVQQVILQIEEQTGGPLKITPYAGTSDNADALLSGEIDVWIVNGAAVVLLTEDEVYEDYMSKVRILEEIPLSSLRVEAPTTEPPTEPPEIPSTIDNAPFVVYISGSDTRSKKFKVSRSDVNIIGVVNPVTKQVLLINTPRDSYVPNPVGNGQRDKLTNCGLYGVNNSMEVLGTLYDVDVDYYCQINFTGFTKLIDAVGGITVYSDQGFTAGHHYISKGKNHLNGKEALAFARERHHVKGGDRGRGKNQMKVIAALIKKLTEGTTIISKYSSILDSLTGLFRTNVTMEEISTLVKMQLSDMASWNILSFAVTGEGDSQKTYSSPGHKAYVMHLDEKLVSYASVLADRMMAGDILTDADLKVPE